MSDSSQTELRKKIVEIEKLGNELQENIRKHRDGMAPQIRDNLDAKLAQLVVCFSEARKILDVGKHGKIALSLGHPDAIARFYAFSLVNFDRVSLEIVSASRFYGSGIYAIYYNGTEIPAYQPLSGSETPIYVGKAVPRDRQAEHTEQQGPTLWNRLREHTKSIRIGGLNPAEFEVRVATVQSGMESAVEDFMIRLFKPIWNKEIKVCFGIGKHGDAATTRKNKRSPWDTMHPGRAWADATIEDQSSRKEIEAKIAAHFNSHPPIQSREQLIHSLALD
jgi:hypothetical protein